jgi:hypothetical protein
VKVVAVSPEEGLRSPAVRTGARFDVVLTVMVTVAVAGLPKTSMTEGVRYLV